MTGVTLTAVLNGIPRPPTQPTRSRVGQLYHNKSAVNLMDIPAIPEGRRGPAQVAGSGPIRAVLVGR